MSTKPTIAYLALDIETTGLNPAEDEILEVAWKVIDSNLYEVEGETFSRVVILTRRGLDRLQLAPDVVRTMHSASGLLGEALGSKSTLNTAINGLSGTVARLRATYDRIHLLGMSIHFDAEFLKAHGFSGLFNDATGIHHRMYDISSVKLALEQAGVDYPKAPKGNHRALADVDEAIEQARIFREMFGALS